MYFLRTFKNSFLTFFDAIPLCNSEYRHWGELVTKPPLPPKQTRKSVFSNLSPSNIDYCPLSKPQQASAGRETQEFSTSFLCSQPGIESVGRWKKLPIKVTNNNQKNIARMLSSVTLNYQVVNIISNKFRFSIFRIVISVKQVSIAP